MERNFVTGCTHFLVHGQVIIIFVVFVCLSVCLFVQSFLSRLRSDLDQTRTYVICLGLVVLSRGEQRRFLVIKINTLILLQYCLKDKIKTIRTVLSFELVIHVSLIHTYCVVMLLQPVSLVEFHLL